MYTSSIERVFLWIVKIGLWLIPLIPLYVSSSMLFPFITGKNFAFRIIVEIIFALWVGLAIASREYRPRPTLLFKAVTVFVAIVFLADILSPNPYRAFFSNYERMEGFMMIGHLYLYFVMLTSVFKTRRDWLVFFHVSLATSLVASYFGLLQRLGYRVSIQGGFRVDATIGNPTYFAAYLLFHIWLLVILIHQFWKRWWQAALYAVILIFELAIIYFTATRGVVLALVLAAPVFVAALIYFWGRVATSAAGWPLGRKIAAWILTLLIVLPLLFWSIRQTEFIKSSQALKRLTNYSLREGTIQDRMLVWKMSLKGVFERPILGWGQENYYLIFQKHYDPGLYGAEPWFDRSHNVFLDWAVHAGIPGLGAYLALLGAAIWQLIRAMRKSPLEIRRPRASAAADGGRSLTGLERNVFFEGLVMLGLFAGDFFQKLFVFDNLNSYLLFFAFLAYSQYLSASALAKGESAQARRSDSRLRSYGAAGAAVMLIVVGAWGWWAHARPIRESKALIATLQLVRTNASADAVTEAFQKTLSYRTFGDTEVREQLGNLGRTVAVSEQGTPEEKKKFIDYALSELRKETDHPAPDVKHLLFRSTILTGVLTLDPAYVGEAESVTSEAVGLSPTKQPVYFERAQFLLSQSRIDEALGALERAWRLEKRFKAAAANLWVFAALKKRADVIQELKEFHTLDDFDEGAIFSIARAYQQAEDFAGALDAYAALVRKQPSSPQYHATYAALLKQAGRFAEARAEAEQAARLDPKFKAEAQQFLEEIR